MREASKSEWQNWVQTGAGFAVSKESVPPKTKILRGRCVLTLKELQKEGLTVDKVPRCRIVVAGYERSVLEEQPDQAIDSPTVSRQTTRVATQLSLAQDFTARLGDVKAAFLQGNDLKEPIYAYMPREI